VPKFGDDLFKPPGVMGIMKVRKGQQSDRVVVAVCSLLTGSKGNIIAEPAELHKTASEAEIWSREQVQFTRAAILKTGLRQNREDKERKEEEEWEKANPGQRARREEKDRVEEEAEIKTLELASKAYTVENEDPSRVLYQSV
jgi:hypothetical protein